MKRFAIFLTVVLAYNITYAKDYRSIPKFTEFNIPHVGNYGPGCRIRFLIPKGSVANVYYGPEEQLGNGGLSVLGMPYQSDSSLLGFNCYRADTPRVKAGWAIPKPGGGWQPNKNSSIAELIPSKAFHFYDLVAINSQGWALTIDDTFGDERFRRRQLSYCLIYEAKAICGQNFMGSLWDIQRDKRADLTPYALKVLRSIEFLEDAPPPALDKP